MATFPKTPGDDVVEKTSVVSGDSVLISDSEDSDKGKWVTVGNFMVDTGLEISKGNVAGHAEVNKFGRNQDVDAAEEAIWDVGGSGATDPYLPGGTWSPTANISHIVSDNAGDNGTVEIQGLDTNWDFLEFTVTLNGTTAVALTTGTPGGASLIRVFRMKNTSGTAFAGNVQCGVGASTPFSTVNTRAQITQGFDQTLMAVYTVPLGKTAYMTNLHSSLNKSGGASTGGVDVILYARSDGGVFRVQHTASLIATGTSAYIKPFNPYPSYAAKTDLVITGNGSTTNFDVSAGFDLILVDD